MFFTTPSTCWPSSKLETISLRASARVSSIMARRDTTILPRRRSIFKIWKGCGVFMSGVMSRTGRISTWLPGKNAVAPSKSTVKPPFTRPKITPSTRSSASKFFSNLTQLSSRRALSRERTASPMAFSIRSTKTSTSSPTPIAADRPAIENSRKGTRPSVFKPTSTIAKSFSIAVTRPRTTVPSIGESAAKLSSKSAAKSSILGFNPASVFCSDTFVSP